MRATDLHCTATAGTPNVNVSLVESGYMTPAPTAVAVGSDGAIWWVDTTQQPHRPRRSGHRMRGADRGRQLELPGHGADRHRADDRRALGRVCAGSLTKVTPNGTGIPGFANTDVGTSTPTSLVMSGTTVWYVDQTNARIGRLAGATLSEWALPRANTGPVGLALAADGAVWYAGRDAERDRALLRGDRGPGSHGRDRGDGRDRRHGGDGVDRRAGRLARRVSQGAQGVQGAQGAAGQNGAAGATGARCDGRDRRRGRARRHGRDRGATGPRGATGKRGPAGKTPKISCTATRCRVVTGKSGGAAAAVAAVAAAARRAAAKASRSACA